ncbi:MAG: hypothetical protein KCHDKBKB_02664 [Elusimicrobia bacterium]|nr:hypothetical protein [Elusimicrobiota bacterium]
MRPLRKLLDFFPVPFWVYFFSILAGTLGLLPRQSPLYDAATRHVLPMAIFLMLISTPLSELFSMGPASVKAMIIGTGTIFFSQVLSFVILLPYLPEDSWKAVGALMGTWIGGSANMVAIKEILQMPDNALSSLVIVDAILSYAWMAFLLFGSSWQKKFDNPAGESIISSKTIIDENPLGGNGDNKPSGIKMMGVLIIGFAVAEICVWSGKFIGGHLSFLPISGWTLLMASTAALLLALTPLHHLKSWGSPRLGTLSLYLVLITIGAKTSLSATLQTPIFLVYGILALTMHGALSLFLGRIFKLPLFLLSTASQANIGGAVSAPIVAEAYRQGTAHLGVLMAVLGAVLGTYLGVAGGYLCKTIALWRG